MKIVINRCYGGFGLSRRAEEVLRLRGIMCTFSKDRSNKDLVAVVEELGDAANGVYSKLRVIEIPDGIDWVIDEYDGMEWVAEKHRVWGDDIE